MIDLGSFAHYLGVAATIAPAESPRTPAQQERLTRMIRDDYRAIWRLLRRLGLPAQQVDDAVQQVFLIAAERLPDIREHSERSFAFGTALRVAQSLRRLKAREPEALEDGLHASPALDPEQLTEQQQLRDQLDAILLAMPLELRSVFVLYELEGMTSPEIAELAGLALGTVASRLRRAREQFRALSARPGSASSRTGSKS